MFIVCYLGNIRGREVFPLRPADGENPCELNEITQGVADAQRIYDGSGLARTLKGESGGQGGKIGLYAIRFRYPERGEGSREKGYMEQVDCASALTSKHCGDQTADCSNGVLVAPVLTPGREEKRQNGRRIKEPGEPSFTLTAQDRHGVAIWRDKNEYATERNTGEILRILRQEIGEKAFTEWGIAILAPFQQAEILQQRVHEKGIFEKRCQQSDFQQCAYNSEIDKQNDNKAREMSNLWFYEELRCASQGWEFQEQFYEQLDNAMQKLSHEAAPPEIFMQSMWEASQGIGVLRKTLSTVQEIWRPFSLQWAEDVRIRRLTPREVWRLQGFPDEYFDKAKAAGISDTQLYKTAGNGVTVCVARAIGERLKEIEEWNTKEWNTKE